MVHLHQISISTPPATSLPLAFAYFQSKDYSTNVWLKKYLLLTVNLVLPNFLCPAVDFFCTPRVARRPQNTLRYNKPLHRSFVLRSLEFDHRH